MSRGKERPYNGMRVLVNGFRALPPDKGAGGAGKFFDSLLTGLSSRVALRVVVSEANRESMPNDRSIEYVIAREETQEEYFPHFEWADIYYDPLNGLGPVLIPPRLPVAVAIMDLQHNVYPQFFPNGMYEARNKAYGFAMGRADGVITISEFERQNIRRVYGLDNVYVVHLTGYMSAKRAAGDLRGRARQLARAPYLICPAIPWRHKNHYRLLEAIGLLRNEVPDLRLVLTGVEKHGSSTSLHSWKVVAEHLESSVEVYGHLPQDEFAGLLAGAKGMVFPSLYEGFGIPVVEAMQMGVPVLAVRETAVPEVAGDAVLYFRDPRNTLAMSEDIRRFWEDDELRAGLSARGREQGSKFSVERFIDETVDALESIRERNAASRASWPQPDYSELKAMKPLTAIVVVEAQGEAVRHEVQRARTALRQCLCSDTPLLFVVDRGVDKETLATAFEVDESYTLASLSDTDEIALAVRFLCESVVNSKYVLYTRTGNLCSASWHATRAALRNLDHIDGAGCAMLDPANQVWTIVFPSTAEAELAEILQSIRPRRLSFFENLILRTSVLESAGSIGSLRLVSGFIHNVPYLSGPAS